MESLFEQYIKERENLSVIKTDRGFVAYKIDFPKCFIKHIFVKKEFRQDGHARFLANQVFELCKDAGVESVICEVDERQLGNKAVLAGIENFGFDFDFTEWPVSFFEMGVTEWDSK